MVCQPTGPYPQVVHVKYRRVPSSSGSIEPAHSGSTQGCVSSSQGSVMVQPGANLNDLVGQQESQNGTQALVRRRHCPWRCVAEPEGMHSHSYVGSKAVQNLLIRGLLHLRRDSKIRHSTTPKHQHPPRMRTKPSAYTFVTATLGSGSAATTRPASSAWHRGQRVSSHGESSKLTGMDRPQSSHSGRKKSP
jgi:hypothetical protein